MVKAKISVVIVYRLRDGAAFEFEVISSNIVNIFPLCSKLSNWCWFTSETDRATLGLTGAEDASCTIILPRDRASAAFSRFSRFNCRNSRALSALCAAEDTLLISQMLNVRTQTHQSHITKLDSGNGQTKRSDNPTIGR